VDTTAADVLGVAAEAAGRFGAVLEKERDRVDEILVNESLVAARAGIDDIFTNPKTGFRSKSGRDAIDASGKLPDDIRMAVARVAGTLKTQRQRDNFDRNIAGAAESAQSQANVHVGNEIRRDDQQSHAALFVQDQQAISVAAAAGDTARVTDILNKQSQRIVAYEDRNGAVVGDAGSDARIQVAVNAARSGGRLVQIAALVDTDPAAAALVLKDHAAELTPKDKQDADDLVDQAQKASRAQSETGRILTAHPEDETSAIAEARKSLDGDIEDDVVRRIQARFGERRNAENESDRQVLESANAKVELSGDLSRLTAAERTVLARRGWLAALRNRATQVRNGDKQITDLQWYENNYLSLTDDELVKADMTEARLHLAEWDWKEMASRQAALKGTGGRGTRDKGLTPRETFDAVLAGARNANLIDAGIVDAATLKPFKPDAKRVGLLRVAVADAILAAQDEKGEVPLNSTESRAAIQSVFDDIVLYDPGMFSFEKQVPRALVPEGGSVDELTPAERRANRSAPDNFRARYPNAPALPPGSTRAGRDARWKALVAAGVPPEEATARVLQEIP